MAGFLVGMEIAERFVTGPEGMNLLIAIPAGIPGTVIAIFLQKVTIAIAGFVIGGYITVGLLRTSALPSWRRTSSLRHDLNSRYIFKPA